jgi:hypothetical protein
LPYWSRILKEVVGLLPWWRPESLLVGLAGREIRATSAKCWSLGEPSARTRRQYGLDLVA